MTLKRAVKALFNVPFYFPEISSTEEFLKLLPGQMGHKYFLGINYQLRKLLFLFLEYVWGLREHRSLPTARSWGFGLTCRFGRCLTVPTGDQHPQTPDQL